MDEVAEHYLDLIDALNDTIDELDDHVEDWPAEQVRGRISQLRHALLHIRRTLAPTRDAIRGVVDGRIELDGSELFPHEVELHFADETLPPVRLDPAFRIGRHPCVQVQP